MEKILVKKVSSDPRLINLWSQIPCIPIKKNERYNHENCKRYNVELAARRIMDTPYEYAKIVISTESLKYQVFSNENFLDKNKINRMNIPPAINNMQLCLSVPPVLIATYPNGQIRLIDGYHRMYCLIKKGYIGAFAWLLSIEQTIAIQDENATFYGDSRV